MSSGATMSKALQESRLIVMAGSGGVGKTTSTINLGAALAEAAPSSQARPAPQPTGIYLAPRSWGIHGAIC